MPPTQYIVGVINCGEVGVGDGIVVEGELLMVTIGDVLVTIVEALLLVCCC